ETLEKTGSLDIDVADKLIENVVSTLEIPVGIAVNFLINGKDYLIPMAIEEASVVAACSNAARMARLGGGFTASATESIMIGQIQIYDYGNLTELQEKILNMKSEILDIANSKSNTLVKLNGGAKDIQLRRLSDRARSAVLHILVDVKDAMGANIVNTMCEAIAPVIEDKCHCRTNLRILSNLTPHRMAHASAVFPKDAIGGEDVVSRIVLASDMASVDPYRAATHNKGIMNGIDAVVLATMNDWRAVEANAHTYTHISDSLSLTRYRATPEGDLMGEINIPISVGTVGGSTNAVPKASLFRKILGVKSAREFSEVLASVGLAQNFAALRALVSEGIQRGHMSLHARNVAITAGAKGNEVEEIAGAMIAAKRISVSYAAELLKKLRNN
ncbi:MAG TPA: hydroxymethylglutaryl-CoA reductase, degradative, partial [Thermoplasmataceae archaeon]|nr:hydroxymethylglutaryl-CoA reductase, degradative [Thermoplasmataceae archaeon]